MDLIWKIFIWYDCLPLILVVWPPQVNMPAPAPAAWSIPTTSRPAVAPVAASTSLSSAVTSPSCPSTAASVQREPIWMNLGTVSHLSLVPAMTKALWCLLDRSSTRTESCGMKIIFESFKIHFCRTSEYLFLDLFVIYHKYYCYLSAVCCMYINVYFFYISPPAPVRRASSAALESLLHCHVSVIIQNHLISSSFKKGFLDSSWLPT